MNRNSAKMVPVAFAQNTRDEVRLMNGDGSIVGALAAEPGMKQTCYVAQPVAIHPHVVGRSPTSGPQGKEYIDDGSAYCMDARGVPQAVAQPVAFHPTQDPISSVDGTTHAMGCGSKQGKATVAVAFKVRGGVEVDSAGKAAGKGYLGSEETAFTLAATQDQWLAAPVPVGTDCYNGAITGDVAATMGTTGSGVNGCGPTVMQAVGSFKPGQSAAARSIGYEAEVAPALEGGGGGNNKPAVHVAMQVRRLTPVECERLQGFPDNWTNIPWRGKFKCGNCGEVFADKYASGVGGLAPAECPECGEEDDIAPECPDGPRYKGLGNSMAVPCMRWIGERIQAATARQEVKP